MSKAYFSLLLHLCLVMSAFGRGSVRSQLSFVSASGGLSIEDLPTKQASSAAMASRRPGFRTAATTPATAVARGPVGGARGGALSAVPGWAQYNSSLERRPLLTKAMTSLVGWALGDFLAQKFIAKGAFDMARFLRLATFGFIYHGPTGHYWYNWLDKKIAGTGPRSVAAKVAIDQAVWCPIFMTCFFAYLGVANGDSLGAIRGKISADLFSAVKGSWKVWPIVHAVNFRFIPTQHRLLYINTVQIGFNIFLSLIGTR